MRVFFGAWCESKAVKISSIDMSDNMKTEGILILQSCIFVSSGASGNDVGGS